MGIFTEKKKRIVLRCSCYYKEMPEESDLIKNSYYLGNKFKTRSPKL